MQFFFVLFFVAFILGGCSEPKVSKQKTQALQESGTLFILMYDDSKVKNSYRVYLNNREAKSFFLTNGATEYQVTQGKTNIQVVKKRKTASIDLLVEKDKRYTLRVIEDENGNIELLQVANRSQE